MGVFIFITCTCCGIVSGVVYDVLYIARCLVCGIRKEVYTVKDKVFTAVTDIIYFIILAAAFVFTSVMFDFEGLRLYMLAACLIGALLYIKSFHVIVAFLFKKAYNRITLRKGRN